MDAHLRDLFEQELDAHTPPPLGTVVQDAMKQGTRLLRRRTLTAAGATATSVLAITAAAWGLAGQHATLPPAATTTGCASPAHGTPDRHSEVSIFLRADITDTQRATLDAALRADPLVRDSRYETREEAYLRFKDLWGQSPQPTRSVQPGALPQSFRVTLKDPQTYPTFAANLRPHSGIDDVVTQHLPTCPPARPGRSGWCTSAGHGSPQRCNGWSRQARRWCARTGWAASPATS